jgi:2,4-dienoyl-CoA reductase-like NADH-dependent reductase (Old Yellow Enzyme family)
MTEATAVEPRGRISLADTGIWNDTHVEAWRPIAALIASIGAVPAIQLAHAGRKAGTMPPWDGGKPYANGEWTDQVVAPSAIPFDADYAVPRELAADDLPAMAAAWVAAAHNALRAGFRAIELHMAHGYLLHEFLSPLCNQRSDEYGGSLENRMRFPLRVAREVRAAWPDNLPLLVRISATDWAPGGWTLDESVALARELKAIGVDMVDCSSGAAVPMRMLFPDAREQMGFPLYQVPFAERVRADAQIATAAVGLITTPQQAQEVVAEGRADIVLLGRELLRHPHWALSAAHALVGVIAWPRQYERARLA